MCEFWKDFLSSQLFGVILGSLLTAGFTCFLDWLKSKREEKIHLREKREETYLKVLDVLTRHEKCCREIYIREEEYEEYDEVQVDFEPFTIEEVEEGYFVVTGVGVEKMIGYTNIETEKGFAFFQKYLKEKGIIEALEEKGIQEGDIVSVYDFEFEFVN